MSESLLTVLKFCMMALIYLFLARVVWVVARELKGTPVAPAPAAAPGAPAAARKNQKGWRLTILDPPALVGSVYPVEGEATIGRGGGCVVPLPADTFISNVHARVFERETQLWVEDLRSTNGTFLNGEQIAEPRRVKRGDKIRVGETVLEATK